jgi:hypothetical protein
VLKARAGQIKTIVQTDAFKRFKLKVEGSVTSISYTNLAETTRTTARMLSQAGAMAHLIIGFIGLQQDSEELKPVQELLALMPDLAKIVAKFDFLEEQISVTQGGDDPTAYVRKSVILVRPRSGG